MGEPSNVVATQDRTTLHGLGEQVLKLVSEGATSQQWAEWLRVPLEHAVAGGDKELTLRLLKAGANGGAGWKGCDDRTLLQAAAEGGNQEIVSALIEKGGSAELNAVSGMKRKTALHRASEGNHPAAARVLMIEGASVGLLDSRQRNAMHYAAEGGNLQLFQDLMIAGVQLNAKDVVGDTPLHLAAANGHGKVVSTLLRRGSKTEVANCQGQHALHVAVNRGDITIVEQLLKAGADPNVRYGQDTISSPLRLGRRDAAITRTLVKHGADLKSADDLGCTALHWAASSGTPAVIDALVQAGADLEARCSSVIIRNAYDFNGLTPLHVAAFWHNLECMASLLHNGSSIHYVDEDGLTPLHVMCKSPLDANSIKAADFLLRRGADETAADKEGRLAVDLVEDSSGVDTTGEDLKRLLANAPMDRVWRRRGMLVMCRSRFTAEERGGREGKANKTLRHKEGTKIDAAAAAAGDATGDNSLVLTRVVRMDADAIFRKIVLFL
ncbi:unnamed protein product [Scytosiphon promiscuus]